MPCKYPPPHAVTLLDLTSINDSYLYQPLYGGCSMVIFQISIPPPIPVGTWHPTVSNNPPFSPIYLFMHLFLVWTPDFLEVSSLQFLSCLCVQIIPSVISGSPVKLTLGSLTPTPIIFFGILPCFLVDGGISGSSWPFLPQSWKNQSFFLGALVSVSEEGC